MVGDTDLYPTGFVVSIFRLRSNRKERLVIQFPYATTDAYYHRLALSYGANR